MTTITGFTDQAYDVTLASGAKAIGAGFVDHFDGRRLAELTAQSRPDLLIVRGPIRPVIWWAIRHRVRTLLLLADSFNTQSAKSRLSGALLGLLTRAPNIEWVANHGNRAAEQLVRIGVPRRKVLAWDYPTFDRPENTPPKTKPSSPAKIIYVGLLAQAKGVDDLIVATKQLVDAGRDVRLDLVGRHDDGRLAGLIAHHRLEGVVHQLGMIDNAEVIVKMRQADIVVVPSRHEYSEGMPLTIYEALCSRTPLVVSDHPMFAGAVIDRESGLVFRAGNTAELADRMTELLDNEALYSRVSEGSAAAWNRLQIPLKWADLITDWIADTSTSRARLATQSFANR
ncbi:glycosyltransferase family 4 protein [Methylobacterium sp. J-088]|uniref:glycosyltransferase family 4 protein n=1 Tax=Methylobacterium sp. J-088 TaxID=2836664 RepID=UPI001FBA731C|nr:glycosyltransferase family 4 protein [Methylobacterium sp. J-088]MCJ2064894.1 glycosyltransferase family 4 protein [Methylobacterium sp. J-088]